MAFVWNTIYVLNLILCIIILSLGIWGYNKTKDKMPLFTGMAFGLFGISHLAFLLELQIPLETPLIIVRLLAYLIVVYALYGLALKK